MTGKTNRPPLDDSKLSWSDFQFSIGRLLLLTTLFAIVLSVRPYLFPDEMDDISVWIVLAVLALFVLFTDWSFWHVRNGNKAIKRGDYLAAVRAYTQALRSDPRNADLHYSRGVAHSWQHEHEAAIRDFTATIELNSRYTLAWAGRAMSRLHRGEFQQAVDDATVAICMEPKMIDVILTLASAYYQLDRTEDALEELAIAISIDPDDWRAHMLRGNVLLTSGNPREALHDFEIAMQHEEADQVVIGHAVAQFRVGRHEAGIQKIEQYVGKYPENADGISALAWLLATCPDDALRDGRRALQLAEEARDLSTPESSWSCETSLAAAHAELGQFDKAVEHGEKALEMTPSSRREENESRLQTYKSGQPFRDHGARDFPSEADEDRNTSVE